MLTTSGEIVVMLNQRRGDYLQVELRHMQPIIDLVTLDVNLDGIYEIVTLDNQGSIHSWSWNSDTRSFQSEAVISLDLSQAKTPTGLFKADVDNNGGVDLIVSYQESADVLLQTEALSYTYFTTVNDGVQGVFDVDGDDRIDLLGQSFAWISQSSTPYNASSLRLRASSTTGDGRINSFGIGGAVEMVSGPLYQKRQIESPIVHLGLGDREQTDMLRILWPNGSVQTEFAELGLASTIFNEQILKGSCPWLFTHNGEEFEFITDVL